MSRQLVLDTETTGLEPSEGHRIIEIGVMELFDRRATGNHYHQYINPQRLVDDESLAIHGISNEFLAGKPLFAEIAEGLVEFCRGTELIIHNAPFDVGFLNHEFALLDPSPGRLEDLCPITDTLVMARKKHPGQRNSLDALCKRYQIDNSSRDLHGAFVDAGILADVYLALTGGQKSLNLGEDGGSEGGAGEAIRRLPVERSRLPVLEPSDQERLEHQRMLERIAKAAGRVLWLERPADAAAPTV